MNAEHAWSEIPPYALWLFGIAAAGWVVGPFSGYYLAKHSKGEVARRQFRDTLNETAAAIHAHRNTGLTKAHADTVPRIRSECAKILEDIRWWKRGRFQRATDRYMALKGQEIDPAIDPKHMTEAFTVAQRGQRFDAARALMVGCLHSIVRYAR